MTVIPLVEEVGKLLGQSAKPALVWGRIVCVTPKWETSLHGSADFSVQFLKDVIGREH